MHLEKPQLFANHKSFILFLLGLAIIISLRLVFLYSEYNEFVNKPFYFTYANVLSQKVKISDGKEYQVLKLRSENGLEFLTTSYQKISYRGKQLRIEIFPDKRITFLGYLSTFFIRSKIKQTITLPTTFKNQLLHKVATQHDDSTIASFYNAIFFASALDAGIREKVAGLGISHLIALSGFHLTILWGLIYGLLLLAYRPFQQRYFPYRYSLIDVGGITLLILASYLWLADFPPSLIRAYAMVVAGWLVLLAGMELFSFTFLFSVIFLLLALFPSLVGSLSFGLSVAGVFMIFLILKYTDNVNKHFVGYIIIPFGIFILMQPIVHGIFGVTSLYQLLSPVLSLLFIPFYPLVIGLHIVGYGGLLDSELHWLFDLNGRIDDQPLSWYFVLGYVAIGLLAIRSKKIFHVLCMLGTGYTGYLYLA